VHQCLVADVVWQVAQLPEELRLKLLDVLMALLAGDHQRQGNVDQDYASEDVGEGILDFDVDTLHFPAEETQVALDGLFGEITLLLEVDVDVDSEVLDLLHAGHAFYVLLGVLGEDLLLHLVHMEVSGRGEALQAPDVLAIYGLSRSG